MLSDVVIRRNVEVGPSPGKGLRPVARGKGPVRELVDLAVEMERRVEGGAKANSAPDHARRIMAGVIPYRRNSVPQSRFRRASIYNSPLTCEVTPSSYPGGFRRIRNRPNPPRELVTGPAFPSRRSLLYTVSDRRCFPTEVLRGQQQTSLVVAVPHFPCDDREQHAGVSQRGFPVSNQQVDCPVFSVLHIKGVLPRFRSSKRNDESFRPKLREKMRFTAVSLVEVEEDEPCISQQRMPIISFGLPQFLDQPRIEPDRIYLRIRAGQGQRNPCNHPRDGYEPLHETFADFRRDSSRQHKPPWPHTDCRLSLLTMSRGMDMRFNSSGVRAVTSLPSRSSDGNCSCRDAASARKQLSSRWLAASHFLIEEWTAAMSASVPTIYSPPTSAASASPGVSSPDSS